jgi:hypothetical protein
VQRQLLVQRLGQRRHRDVVQGGAQPARRHDHVVRGRQVSQGGGDGGHVVTYHHHLRAPASIKLDMANHLDVN